QLICAVRCHRQKSSADKASPESERHAPVPREREDLKLARWRSRRAYSRLSGGDDSVPAAGNKMHQFISCKERPSDVDDELNQVRPDDSRYAALESVDESQQADDDDRPEPKMRKVWET